ncbi:hypothetical protein BX600DRAFT_538696 [Xylariales sp. PMI_506]|nr:hypothetical protein BX600DRAFT_538696 [Xylariales sp. PMI_506]
MMRWRIETVSCPRKPTMAKLQPWLELRSVPGADCLFLHEHHAPYASMVGSANDRPQIIVAIGSTQKRTFLEKHLSVTKNQANTDAIRFSALRDTVTLLIASFIARHTHLIRATWTQVFYMNYDFRLRTYPESPKGFTLKSCASLQMLSCYLPQTWAACPVFQHILCT